MNVFIETEIDIKFDFDYEQTIKDVINYAVDYINCPYEAEVNVVLTDDESIHSVNMEYRNIDRATDVLSFPMIEYDEPGNFEQVEENEDYFNPDTGELILGDIMISVEKVTNQSLAYGHSEKRELAFLVAHSMLHLFGYDHMVEDEAKIMESKQNEIMDNLKIFR